MKKAGYIERYGRPGTERGFHFLTGTEASIAQLTETVGFRYAWDEDIKQYAHAAGIMVLTPDGRVSKYFYGLEYSPRDLRLGLVEASDREDRHAGRHAAALLLPLRPDHGEVRAGRDAHGAGSAASC